jgi:hypothetical protein
MKVFSKVMFTKMLLINMVFHIGHQKMIMLNSECVDCDIIRFSFITAAILVDAMMAVEKMTMKTVLMQLDRLSSMVYHTLMQIMRSKFHLYSLY